MDKYLTEIYKTYSKVTKKTVSKIEKTLLKDVQSIFSLREVQGRLTDTVIQVFEKIQEKVKEHDALLKSSDVYIRKEYNVCLFNLYFAAHRWSYYGLGTYVRAH